VSQVFRRRLCRGSCPGLWEDEAAREENTAAAVRPSSLASPRRGRCVLLGISAIPTRVS
jgi:hypothetical protein